MDQIVSRYRILEELGSGGMGVVYKAEDPALGRIVALKMVSDSLAEDPLYRERFQREARSASALNHPHVCAVYDIGSHQGRPFLVMEYVEGRTLAETVGAPLPESDVRRFGAEIAEALQVAHKAGIIHRDIKPANLMITEHGHVKILDFGLAKRQPAAGTPPPIQEASAAATRLSEERALLGTARYMSPEQVRGRALGHASDIFSLGIVLYELAAGRHPFEAEDRFGLFNAIATQAPIAPSTIRPDLSQDFERVILQMLEKEPRLRPQAAEAAKRLRRSRPRSKTPPQGRRASRPSVGRTTEHELLNQCLRAVESGEGMLVCVTGEAGIGKSTLVEDFFEELKSGAVSVTLARGRCLEHLVAGGGYLPFLDALESLLRGGDSETAARLMQLLAPTWHAHLAPLSEDPAQSAQLAASQERFKRELFAFFSELTRSRPLVLLLDDLHWADASTIDLLAFLGGKLDGLRVLLLVAYRPAELLLAKHPFVDLQLELQGRGLCRELPLQFLTPEDIERYVKLEFPGHCFPAEFLALVHDRTEGSPLFMVDLLRYLRDRGEIIQDDGGWTLKRPTSEVESQFPRSAPVMIKRKMGLLDKAQRHLLVTASVQGAECDSAVVAQAMEADPADVEEDMETLANVHGFLKKLGERDFPDGTPTVAYRFVHVLYQNAFYESLQPTRRRQLSASVAAAMLQLHGERRHDVAAELALLLEAARDHRRAAEHFRLAAERNARLFASQEAVVLARLGLTQLQHLPPGSERRRIELELQLVLGPALMAMKGFASPEVQETYARARLLCEQAGETPKTFPTLHGLWQYYVMRADFPAARQLAEQLHSLAGDDLDVLPEACRALGETAHWRGETNAAQSLLERANAVYDPETHRSHAVLYGLDPRVASLSMLSWTLWTRGYPDQALEKARAGIEWAETLSHPFTLAYASFAAAGLYFFRREAPQCLETAQRAIQLSTEEGFPFWLGTSSAARGWALAQLGRGEEGVAQLHEAMAIYRATGAKIALPWFHFMLADVLAAAGDAEQALRLVKEARRHLEKNGDRWWEAEVSRIHGEILLTRSADQAAAAEACFRKSIEVARRQGARSWELRGAISLTRLLRRQGRIAEAKQILEPVYQSFTEGFDSGDLRDAKALVAGWG